MIGETDELIIICVAEGNIGRQAIAKFRILVGVDWGIKGMRITDQTMLRVGQASDHTIVRIGTGQSRFPISGKIRGQEMIIQIEQTSGGSTGRPVAGGATPTPSVWVVEPFWVKIDPVVVKCAHEARKTITSEFVRARCVKKHTCDGWTLWSSHTGQPREFPDRALAMAAIHQYLCEIEDDIAIGERHAQDSYELNDFFIVEAP